MTNAEAAAWLKERWIAETKSLVRKYQEAQYNQSFAFDDLNEDGDTWQAGGFGMAGVTPQAQQAHIVDADGTLADITTKFNTLLADLEGYGFLATS